MSHVCNHGTDQSDRRMNVARFCDLICTFELWTETCFASTESADSSHVRLQISTLGLIFAISHGWKFLSFFQAKKLSLRVLFFSSFACSSWVSVPWCKTQSLLVAGAVWLHLDPPRLSTALKDRSVVPYSSPKVSACPHYHVSNSVIFLHRAGTIAKGYPLYCAIQAVLKGRTGAIRKGNKHQLGLFFLLEACQRNAAGWSTAGWPANAKLQLPHRHSSITRPCCSIESSSAKLLVFTCTSSTRQAQNVSTRRVNAPSR